MMIMSKQEFLVSSGVELHALEIWLERRWLLPQESTGELNFSAMDLARARLILDLLGDFGVNDEGVDVILHLTDQIYGLRNALAQLVRYNKSRDETDVAKTNSED